MRGHAQLGWHALPPGSRVCSSCGWESWSCAEFGVPARHPLRTRVPGTWPGSPGPPQASHSDHLLLPPGRSWGLPSPLHGSPGKPVAGPLGPLLCRQLCVTPCPGEWAPRAPPARLLCPLWAVILRRGLPRGAVAMGVTRRSPVRDLEPSAAQRRAQSVVTWVRLVPFLIRNDTCALQCLEFQRNLPTVLRPDHTRVLVCTAVRPVSLAGTTPAPT